MESTKTNAFIDALRSFAKAKSPIDPTLLEIIPYFSMVFPDKGMHALLASLCGEDGIAYLEKKRFKPNERLIGKGQIDQMIYWVLEGQVNVVTTINNQPKVIHKSTRGECFGALGVLRGTIRNADVVAGDKGVTVLELDWSLTDRNQELGKNLYHLIALNLADNLDNSYDKQLKIISNSLNVLHEKTYMLIKKNRKIEKLLEQNNISFENDSATDHAQALEQAIVNIRESLSLLENQEEKRNLDQLNTI
ncbi:MAG: cyclic nucleotide-binding domain-containing protein [Desulfobulbaceae bacterium]|nr:cyclic nucleotide-binding domain-containing protein [Desulfobulbaceae bacterium]